MANFLTNLLQSFVKTLGNNELVQVLETSLIAEAESEGEVAVERALTIPAATIQAAASHHGLTAEQVTDIEAFAKDFALRGASLLAVIGTGSLPADSPYQFTADAPMASTPATENGLPNGG